MLRIIDTDPEGQDQISLTMAKRTRRKLRTYAQSTNTSTASLVRVGISLVLARLDAGETLTEIVGESASV